MRWRHPREVAMIVRQLKPGHAVRFTEQHLRDVDPIPGCTVEQSILEHVIGAAYGWSAMRHPMSNDVTFYRRRDPLPEGLRTCVSYDRAHLFRLRTDGLYEPIT